MAGPWTFTTQTWIPAPLQAVFDFFSRAENLERLTPRALSFAILTPAPIVMTEGTLIDYRIRLRGIPLRWRTRIAAWEPPTRFVDEQLRGPYRSWVHEHRFSARDGGTDMADRVTYSIAGGPLASLVHASFVRREVKRIFAHRERALREVFAP